MRLSRLLLALCVTLTTTPARAGPITMVKTATTKSDPMSSLLPLAIPGAIIEYQIAMTGGTASATSVQIVDAVPAGMTFCLPTFDLVAGPVVFADTSFLFSSGIGFTYTAVNNASDGLEFSKFTSGTDWTYQPANGAICDTQIKRFRITFSGIFGAGKTANVRYRMQVN